MYKIVKKMEYFEYLKIFTVIFIVVNLYFVSMHILHTILSSIVEFIIVQIIGTPIGIVVFIILIFLGLLEYTKK